MMKDFVFMFILFDLIFKMEHCFIVETNEIFLIYKVSSFYDTIKKKKILRKKDKRKYRIKFSYVSLCFEDNLIYQVHII